MDYRDYVDFFKSRCGELGCAVMERVQIDDMAFDVVAHKEGFELSKLGNAAHFYFLGRRQRISTEEFRRLSGACYRYALDNRRNKLPRGLFNGIFAFPFLCVESVDAQTAEFAQDYRPSHWSSLEFPTLVDLTGDKTHYYRKTPL